MKWFKMYSSLARNKKAHSLEDAVFRTWVNLLAIYSEDNEFPDAEQIAYDLRRNTGEIEEHIKVLLEARLLLTDKRGKLKPYDWEKYNSASISTERVQRYRAGREYETNETIGTNETDETHETGKHEQVSKQEMSKVSKQMSKDVSKLISYSNGQGFTHEQREVVENKETPISVSSVSNVSSVSKRLRVDKSRVDKSRKEEEHSYPNPFSLTHEQGDEQEPPSAQNALCVSTDTLNGNGKPHGKTKPSILNPEQQVWFESFWGDYWRKNDKHPGLVAFGKQIRTESDFQRLVAAFERDRAEMLTRPVDKRPCLGPWVNKKPWLDDDLSDVPQQVKISPKEAASEAVYREYLAELENKGKTQ